MSRFGGWKLSVGRRLLLGLVPALLAVVLSLGLAWYGQYARAAPATVVAAAAVLSLLSLAVTGHNAQYLRRRITRLAREGSGVASAADIGDDELDRIEQAVERLGSDLVVTRAEGEVAVQVAQQRLAEHAALLTATVAATLARLDEVRIPLHILLETKFGSLNENQEELLGAARDAADAIDGSIRLLGQIADADRGGMLVRLERVRVNDIIRAAVAVAKAAAARTGAEVIADLDVALSPIQGDRIRFAEAVQLLLEAINGALTDGASLQVSSLRGAGAAQIVFRLRDGELPAATDARLQLAVRLLQAQGMMVHLENSRWTIDAPFAGAMGATTA